MRYAIIVNEKVVNIAVAEKDFAEQQGWVELIGNAGIGWSYINGEFVAPPPPDYTEENKNNAIRMLTETDWVELPSVSNTSLNPHLQNVNDFLSYRTQLRAIAVNPPSQKIIFPAKPDEIWSN